MGPQYIVLWRVDSILIYWLISYKLRLRLTFIGLKYNRRRCFIALDVRKTGLRGNPGYYIVQVRKRQAPSPMAFEEARPLIEAELKGRKHDELVLNMENSLLEQADMVIFEPVIEAMLAKN